MLDDSAPAIPETPAEMPAPRRRGGSRKGIPNRTSAELRDFIRDQARPVEFLAAVVAGKRVNIGAQAGPGAVWARPTLQQRIDAATVLARKILGDQKIEDVTIGGKAGSPVQVILSREDAGLL